MPSRYVVDKTALKKDFRSLRPLRFLSPPPSESRIPGAAYLPVAVQGSFDVDRRIETSVSKILNDVIDRESIDDAFCLVDLSVVAKKLQQWRALLPRVKPFYAVKCNPDPAVLLLLAELGASFDCASKTEINSVLACGVPVSRILYANPCKAPAELRFAVSRGVTMMTFDNSDELEKIHRLAPEAKLVLRILVDDDHSHCPLGSKFGANLGDCPQLLRTALGLGLDVVGVSFHVGSGCYDPEAWVAAIRDARKVFDMAAELGHELRILDLGGGYPGLDDDNISMARIAAAVAPVLDALFPDAEIVAEPGRYFVEASHTLAVAVTNKRRGPAGDTDFQYSISEGVYGMFKDRLLLGVNFEPHVLPRGEFAKAGAAASLKSTVVGPTGESRDVVAQRVDLPELFVGDWLFFPNMGAYTVAIASCFNGFARPRPVYVYQDPAGTQA